jgi:hypothetical protein
MIANRKFERIVNMCMMLYLGSDAELPLIPWDDNIHQSICVNELNDPIEYVRKHFSKPFIYYVGAYEGCGCGFSFGIYEAIDEDDRLAYELGKKSVSDLFKYLRANSELTNNFEMYSCLAGDEPIPPEKHETIFLNEFEIGDSFEFKDRQFIMVYK